MKLILPLLFFCISTQATPGPNNLMIMTSGLNHGIRKSLPHFFGILLGFPLMVALIGLGLSSIFLQYPIFQHSIKIIGICYILYLAWKIATTNTTPQSVETTDAVKPLSFIQAALFQWANPKAWIMAIGALSAFSSISLNLTCDALIIASCFLLMGIPATGLWLFFGVGLQRYLSCPTLMKKFNLFMAVLLAASIILIVFE